MFVLLTRLVAYHKRIILRTSQVDEMLRAKWAGRDVELPILSLGCTTLPTSLHVHQSGNSFGFQWRIHRIGMTDRIIIFQIWGRLCSSLKHSLNIAKISEIFYKNAFKIIWWITQENYSHYFITTYKILMFAIKCFIISICLKRKLWKLLSIQWQKNNFRSL